MKKTVLILIFALLLGGCTYHPGVSDPDSPGRQTAGKDKPLSFDCYIDYYWEVTETASAKESAGDEYAGFHSDNYHQDKFKMGDYEYKDIVPLKEDEANANADLYAKCCEWLAANYSTGCFVSKESMINGIESRYTFLSKELREKLEETAYTTAWVDERFEPAVECKAADGQNANFAANRYYTQYASSSKELKGYFFRFYFYYRGKTMDFLPRYITEKGVYAKISPATNDSGIDHYGSTAGFCVEILVDDDGQICDFREIYKKLDAEKTSYWLYDETGVTTGCDGFYYPPEPANISGAGILIRTTKKTVTANEIGARFYKALIGLSDRKEEFDALPFSEKLDRGILDGIVSDVEKYGVRFEIDPTCAKAIDDTRFSYVYESEEYGEVYMVQRNALVKTGSQEFNDKYGLNVDRQLSSVNVYLCEENGELKICAVKIFSSSELWTEESLNEYWSGNGNRG